MLYNLRVITSQNNSLILGEVATFSDKLPYSSISRQDGYREVTITGDLNPEVLNTTQARNFLINNGLEKITDKYNLSL